MTAVSLSHVQVYNTSYAHIPEAELLSPQSAQEIATRQFWARIAVTWKAAAWSQTSENLLFSFRCAI